jgi:tRNA-dihydrouridine synthase
MELHLASMENITCWAFRKLFQATDSYTGVLSLNHILRKKTWKEVDLFPISGQRQWIQIATSKEAECQKFIERLLRECKEQPEKYNVYGIQLNCSCPSPYLTNIGQGPALIKRAQKVSSLLRILLKQDKFKVSVKVRLGLAEEEVKQGKIFQLFSELEKINNKNFVHAVVHFKHAREPSCTPYDYSMLKRLSNYKIPIIINGGINSYNDFVRITCDANRNNIIGFMMGREALRNPDCFTDVRMASHSEHPKNEDIHFFGSSKILNNKNFAPRTSEQIKKEFEDNCKLHLPKEVYVRTIQKYCPWAKDLKIEFPVEERVSACY